MLTESSCTTGPQRPLLYVIHILVPALPVFRPSHFWNKTSHTFLLQTPIRNVKVLQRLKASEQLTYISWLIPLIGSKTIIGAPPVNPVLKVIHFEGAVPWPVETEGNFVIQQETHDLHSDTGTQLKARTTHAQAAGNFWVQSKHRWDHRHSEGQRVPFHLASCL